MPSAVSTYSSLQMHCEIVSPTHCSVSPHEPPHGSGGTGAVVAGPGGVVAGPGGVVAGPGGVVTCTQVTPSPEKFGGQLQVYSSELESVLHVAF